MIPVCIVVIRRNTYRFSFACLLCFRQNNTYIYTKYTGTPTAPQMPTNIYMYQVYIYIHTFSTSSETFSASASEKFPCTSPSISTLGAHRAPQQGRTGGGKNGERERVRVGGGPADDSSGMASLLSTRKLIVDVYQHQRELHCVWYNTKQQ